MRFGLLAGGAAAIGLLLSSLSAPAAVAAGAVSISSSGLSTLKTYTYQDSDEGYIVFTVNDPRREGTQVSQCWVDSDGDLYECDVYPLKETDYRSGDWRIRPVSGGWEVRVYVGFYDVSEDECLDQYRGAAEYGVDLAILGDDEEVLAESRHAYELICQGYAGSTRGSTLITASIGRASTAINVVVTAIDAGHDAAAAKACTYASSTGRATNCVALDMGSSKSTRGWSHAQRISFSAVNARQCKSLKRNPARYTYRVVFKDSRGDVLMTVDHDFKVTCR